MSLPSPAPPRVFLSYSWDSDAHKQRVLALSQRLREDGINAWIDRFTTSPEEGWPQWMQNQLAQATFVLVVSTETYQKRFSKCGQAGVGLGAAWEGAIITQDLYATAARNFKYIPVVFNDADVVHVPMPLPAFTIYRLTSDAGYEALCRHLMGQPEIIPAPVGAWRTMAGSAGTPYPKSPSLPMPEVFTHAAFRSNLPPRGSFFGREAELEAIAIALEPETRTWGVLIDGPGGIGKTSLAIYAAETTPTGRFERIIFLSAKARELTPDGERTLVGFVLPGYLEMLNEMSVQLGQPQLSVSREEDAASHLVHALQSENTLLVLDNLETLPSEDRERLHTFLSRLPRRCKAIVTSRRRIDIDGKIVSLGRLEPKAALDYIAELAKDRPLLARATKQERQKLYEETGGNPLVVRWLAGQLGRGKCRDVAAALDFLRSAPIGNDPLQFIFGDLLDTFTESETKVLAALAHFTAPVEVKFIAELAEVTPSAANIALVDLAGRALVIDDPEAKHYGLVQLVADFLRRARPEAVGATGNRLENNAYVLSVENGYERHDRFPALDDAWPAIAAALPLFLQGPNVRLQTLCHALGHFLSFTGRWDEWLALALEAEKRAVEAKDFTKAAWRAFDAGWVYYRRGMPAEVLCFADRATTHFRAANASGREPGLAMRLRGHGFRLSGNYTAAIEAYREAVAFSRTRSPDSASVALDLNALAGTERRLKQFDEAEMHFREALRIATAIGYKEGVATLTVGLSTLAIDRNEWHDAETLAIDALRMAKSLGRKELIAAASANLAESLLARGLIEEGRPHARCAVEIYSALGSRDLDRARRTLQACES